MTVDNLWNVAAMRLRNFGLLLKSFSVFTGTVIGSLILMIFYFTFMVPFALITRMTRDPLRLAPPRASSFWIAASKEPPTLENARLQF